MQKSVCAGPREREGTEEHRLSLAGAMTVCDFTEDDALSTVGARAALVKAGALPDGVDLEAQARFIDVVCTKPKSRAGRALVASLLIDLVKYRGRSRKKFVVSVAVSRGGYDLLHAFGFTAVKFGSSDVNLMILDLQDVRMPLITTVLRFEGSNQILPRCYRHGRTKPSRHKVYSMGCH